MQVRKYEATTIKEAVDMVKKDLGPDAIILSTRESVKGLGNKAGKTVMITAAVSEKTYQMKKVVEENITARERERLMTRPVKEQREFINHVYGNIKTNIEEKRRKIASRNYATIMDDDFIEEEEEMQPLRKTAIPQRRTVHIPERSIEAQGASMSQAKKRVKAAAEEAFRATEILEAPAQASTAAMAAKVDAQKIDELKNEIKRLQSILKGVDSFPAQLPAHSGSKHGISANLSYMFDKLVGEGFEEKAVAELLKNADNKLQENTKKKGLVDAWVARWIYASTEIVKEPLVGRYHFFVGPRGVGKTSTLVKMASHLVLKERKRVAIITTDSDKVGASEQLRIYAQILNVPFAIWQKGQDLNVYLNQLKNVDYILFDTEGRSLNSLEEIDSLKQVIPASLGNARVHLVLSALLKDEELYSAARRFKSMNYQDVVFTNVDQLRRHGVLVNFQQHVRSPYFAFSMGPMIPEDFEWASKERVLDLIFKISKSKVEGDKHD